MQFGGLVGGRVGKCGVLVGGRWLHHSQLGDHLERIRRARGGGTRMDQARGGGRMDQSPHENEDGDEEDGDGDGDGGG